MKIEETTITPELILVAAAYGKTPEKFLADAKALQAEITKKYPDYPDKEMQKWVLEMMQDE